MLRLPPATPTLSRRLLTARICSPSATSKLRARQGSENMHGNGKATRVPQVVPFLTGGRGPSPLLGSPAARIAQAARRLHLMPTQLSTMSRHLKKEPFSYLGGLAGCLENRSVLACG